MASELIFPENTLILMCAAPGCGKSTFASRNFLSTQIVSSDQCRAMVCDDMEDMSVHKETFSLVRHIARMRMRLGKLTVIDSTALSRRMRCSFRKLATGLPISEWVDFAGYSIGTLFGAKPEKKQEGGFSRHSALSCFIATDKTNRSERRV